MNVFSRRLLPWAATIVLAISPAAVQGQDAAAAKATFDAVNQHLDLGGQFYGFLNVDGDVEALAAKAQELYERFQGMDDDIPPGLDIAAFITELGLDNLDAVGLSSIKFDKGYRNRFFAAIDGERRGVLKLLGGDPKPFSIGEFATASAVYALEWDLDLGGAKELVSGIGKQLEKVMGMDPTSQVLMQPIPGTELNVSELLDALKGLVMAYVEIDDEKQLEIPDPNAPEIPGIDLVFSHDSGGKVFGVIKSFVTTNAPPDAYVLEEENGVSRLKITLPDDASLGFYAPVVQFDEGSGALLIATREEALARQAQGDRLADAPDFKRLAAMLPKEGNGYAFMSPKLYDFIDIFMEAARAAGPTGVAELQAKMMREVYGEPQAMAGMWANQKDGIYSESIAPMSYKISLAYTALVPIGISAAIVAPMAARGQIVPLP